MAVRSQENQATHQLSGWDLSALLPADPDSNGSGSTPSPAAVEESLAQVEGSDTELYGRYFHAMLERGVYLAPSQFEAGFVSLAHTEEDIDRTVAIAEEALRSLG